MAGRFSRFSSRSRMAGSGTFSCTPIPSDCNTSAPRTEHPSRFRRLLRLPIMRITLFAATGGVGREVLDQAVAAGHHVTAVVRNPKTLVRQVATVTADLAAPDPGVLESAIKGADAVVSCLG